MERMAGWFTSRWRECFKPFGFLLFFSSSLPFLESHHKTKKAINGFCNTTFLHWVRFWGRQNGQEFIDDSNGSIYTTFIIESLTSVSYSEALDSENKIYGLAYKSVPNILWQELPEELKEKPKKLKVQSPFPRSLPRAFLFSSFSKVPGIVFLTGSLDGSYHLRSLGTTALILIPPCVVQQPPALVSWGARYKCRSSGSTPHLLCHNLPVNKMFRWFLSTVFPNFNAQMNHWDLGKMQILIQ